MYTASGSGVVVVEDDRVGRGHLGVVVPILGRLCQNKSTHYDLVKNKSAISQILRAEIYNIFGSSFLFSVTTYLVYIATRRQYHLKIDRDYTYYFKTTLIYIVIVFFGNYITNTSTVSRY